MNVRFRRYDTGTTLARFIAVACLGLAATVATPSDARACVAEVYVQDETVSVSAHETAMAMSHSGSTMWFRLEFNGNPKDFGILIPASPGSTVDVAEEQFFDTLRSLTTPVIRQVSTDSARGGGCGCGSAVGGSDDGDNGGVTVVSAANVGPYATVTLRATESDALGKWLDANGFKIDEAAKAAAATYVAEGLDFIAVKFRPGASSTKMPALRVDTPTHDMRVLLRMAQSGAGAGAGAATDMVLYLLDSTRMRPQNFPESVVDPAKIYFSGGKSNYDAQSRELMAEGGGRTWITEFAGNVTQSDYYRACRELKVEGSRPIVDPIVNPADAAIDVHTTDAGADAASDGGGTSNDASGAEPEPSEPDLGTEPESPEPIEKCSGTDLMRRASLGTTAVYITRLRASLPRSALSQDLILEPHPNREDVQRTIIAGGNPQASIGGGSRHHGGALLLIGATVLGLAVVKRRSRRP